MSEPTLKLAAHEEQCQEPEEPPAGHQLASPVKTILGDVDQHGQLA